MAGDMGAQGHAQGRDCQAQQCGRRALTDAAILKKFADQSYEITPRENLTPEHLLKFHKGEIEKWFPIIKAAGIKGG